MDGVLWQLRRTAQSAVTQSLKIKPVTYILVQKVVQSLSQSLPGELKQRDLQELIKAQQSVPQTQHHRTCRTGQWHAGLVLLGWKRQPPKKRKVKKKKEFSSLFGLLNMTVFAFGCSWTHRTRLHYSQEIQSGKASVNHQSWACADI